MDRITDSGSVDWGSTPHGHTERLPGRFSYALNYQLIIFYCVASKHTMSIRGYVLTLQRFEELLKEGVKDGSVIITECEIETDKTFEI